MLNRRTANVLALAAAALVLAPGPARGQLGPSPRGAARAGTAVGPGAPDLEARVWLDRGDEPLLRTGDQVRVYYRTTRDAYVSIFHVDTDGTTTLVYPSSPDDDPSVRGGADYRLLFPRSSYWFVDDQPGMGYFFIVASPVPFDFSQFRFSRYDIGWDLGRVGRQVYRDPFEAMDDYVAALLPDWEDVPYALDFTSYDVGQPFQYPRFLCYQCHEFRAYAAWNPYYASCTNFRVVIYDDPYFYPSHRYRADRVVWVRPGPDRSRFAFKERRPGEPAAPLLRQIVGERTRGVLAPAPRRSLSDGTGGRTSVTRAPAMRTPSGAVRGGPTPPARRPSGTDSAPGAPPRLDETPAPDARPRPVLRKRPSDAAGAPATPGASAGGATSGGAQTLPPRPSPEPTPPPRAARPRGEPSSASPAPPRERAPAREPPSGGSGSAPSTGGGGRAPTVRKTPDGRPVIRRPG